MNLRNRIVDFLFSIYTLPLKHNYRMAMSFSNRILGSHQHLAAMTLLLNRLDSQKFGSLILDVGSHSGDTSEFFIRNCPSFSVIGFEPIPSVFQLSKQKYIGNKKMKFENIALSNENGAADFFISDNLVSSSLNSFKNLDNRFKIKKKEVVQMRTLDDYMISNNLANVNVACMKVDVQGHELKVFEGAKTTLRKTHYVVTEMANHHDYSGGACYHEVDLFLRNHGFELQNLFSSFSYEKLYEFDAIYVNQQI